MAVNMASVDRQALIRALGGVNFAWSPQDIRIYDSTQPPADTDSPSGNYVEYSITPASVFGVAAEGISKFSGTLTTTVSDASTADAVWARLFLFGIASSTDYIDFPVSVSGSEGIRVDALPLNGDPVIQDFSIYLPENLGDTRINMGIRNALLDEMLRGTSNPNMNTSSPEALTEIYSGSAPASADDTATGTLLASFSSTKFTTNFNDYGALISSNTVSATDTGTIGYARLIGGTSGEFVIQGTAGSAGTNDFVLDSDTTTISTNITLNSFLITG